MQSTVANFYQWYFNNSIISSATNQTLAITTNGNYSVKIDSTNGCVNISDSFPASSVGIAGINNTDNEIRIYPNPAKDELFIETSSNEKLCVQLFDMTGKEVSENISFTNHATINIYTKFKYIFVKKMSNSTIFKIKESELEIKRPINKNTKIVSKRLMLAGF